MKLWKKCCAILISATALLAGCHPTAWEAPDAAFLVVDSAYVVGNPDSFGSLRHTITTVWLFDSTQFLGAFPLDRPIPIPETSWGQLSLKAGIRESGLSNATAPYPFFRAVRIPFTPPPWHADTLRLAFRYSPAVRFWVREDFEHSWSYWDVSERTAAEGGRTTAPEEVFEGNGTFKGTIQPGGVLEIVTHDSFTFDTVRSSIYMELHYRTSTVMVIGAYFRQDRSRTQRALIYLKPSGQWRKLYLNFSDFLSDLPDGTTTRFFIGAWDQDSTTDHIWLDNIKILSF